MSELDIEWSLDDLPSIDESEFAPLPEGWYDVSITKTELKNTKTGNGQYISVRYKVNGPTHAGRVVFGNLNIRNQNQQAEEIGRRDLAALLTATGLTKILNTDALFGKRLMIKLKIRQQDGYEPSNDVKAYKAIDGANGGIPAMTGQAQPPVAHATSSKPAPPWGVKKPQ